jgi:hypothetical protein
MADRNQASKRPKPKSYAERLDPGGKLGEQAKGLGVLAGPFFGPVLRRLGVDRATLEQARQAPATYERLIAGPDRIAALLGPLGWIPHNLAHAEAYEAAATLVEEGKVEEAEELLVAAYGENDHAFIRFHNRVWSLYQGDDSRRAIGRERQRLLNEAFELHKEGRYAGAISIVLAQIDGIFIDMTGKPTKYFFDPKNPNLVDDVTIAGHPLGLKALSELMSREQRTTVISDKLTRQGILHGRVLAYDTLTNATKVWSALLAVIEAVGPRAQELNAQAAADYEGHWAGSEARDEWGMRRDQRGFAEAKRLLHTVHSYQFGFFKRNGFFAPDLDTLDVSGELATAPGLELSVDGDGYWAWMPTPTGIVFGVAARDADFNSYWVYVCTEAPVGGVHADSRWRHITDPDLSVDW